MRICQLGRWAADAAFARRCQACSRTLPWGSVGLWCGGCEVSVEPGGTTVSGPCGRPLWAQWTYAGAVATAIVRAKADGQRLDLSGIAGPWRTLVQQALAQTAADWLCAVAPQQVRLGQRGWHLPDQLTRLAAVPLRVVLHRTDVAAPRRTDRDTPPQFVASPGRGRVLLVDDVVTTGTTLAAAAAALQRAGYQPVGCAVLADARPQALARALQRQEGSQVCLRTS